MFSGCGIAGCVRFESRTVMQTDLASVRRMTSAMAHRGPHGHGLWQEGGVVLGHRRLSILDLSSSGAQPMKCGPLTITYNGELYNFEALRKELASEYTFCSGTDTEVVARAWQKWGERALDRFEGMYAFALWNSDTGELIVARDRIGIKPLYYFRSGEVFLFASEVEALLNSGLVPPRPNMEAIHHQLLCSSTLEVDPTRTPVAGVHALPAATVLRLNAATGASVQRTYWALPRSTGAPVAERLELAAAFGDMIGRSIRSMLIGDVPVAAFLSGGMDSSCIVREAADASRITCITVASADSDGALVAEDNPDVHYSRVVAAHCGSSVDHRVVLHRSSMELSDLDAVCDLGSVNDDIRHVNILSNYRCVSELGMRVVLNGQGADELMGGYLGLPGFSRNVVDLRSPSLSTIETLPASRQAEGLAGVVLAQRAAAHAAVLDMHASLPGEALERAHRFLFHTQLRRVLQFEDFLSMRASIEARVPFLDHRIVQWCFEQPFDLHVNLEAGYGKAMLRLAMARRLPDMLCQRPKQVFPFPDRRAVHASLRAIANAHESELRSDELIRHLFTLPWPGELDKLSLPALWSMLMMWRWHRRLHRACAAE